MNKLKVYHKNLSVVYVFSKDNQVYLKKDTILKTNYKNDIKDEEWFPIKFHWKSITES